jgi:hypothetical protein
MIFATQKGKPPDGFPAILVPSASAARSAKIRIFAVCLTQAADSKRHKLPATDRVVKRVTPLQTTTRAKIRKNSAN